MGIYGYFETKNGYTIAIFVIHHSSAANQLLNAPMINDNKIWVFMGIDTPANTSLRAIAKQPLHMHVDNAIRSNTSLTER